VRGEARSLRDRARLKSDVATTENEGVGDLLNVLGVALAGSTIGTALVGWLGGRLIEHRLQRDLERWRVELTTISETRREVAKLRVSRTLAFLRSFEALVEAIYEEPAENAHVSDYVELDPCLTAKRELDAVFPTALRKELDAALDDFEEGSWRRAVPQVREAVEKLLHGDG
jgi:hypothetical protein